MLQIKVKDSSDDLIKIILILVAGLVVPVFLIPLIQLTKNSEIIEELAKALLIFFLVLNLRGIGKKFLVVIFLGFFFGLSETFFYLVNILQFGKEEIFNQRLILVIPMHIITCVIILIPALKNKWLIIAGVFMAVATHLFFNSLIS